VGVGDGVEPGAEAGCVGADGLEPTSWLGRCARATRQ
jgi:hypothetical protein